MTTRKATLVAGLALSVGLVIAVCAASAAGADVVTGNCFGQGSWQGSGQDEDSAEHNPTDIIEIPRADTVAWEGREGDGVTPGPERDHNGEVEVVLPGDVPITIDSWNSTDSTTYSSQGTHTYDLPSLLVGVKVKLQGEHRVNGASFCRGSVFLQVGGSSFSNPLAWAGIVVTVASAVGVVTAAFNKVG